LHNSIFKDEQYFFENTSGVIHMAAQGQVLPIGGVKYSSIETADELL
jgi:hypothetical protein